MTVMHRKGKSLKRVKVGEMKEKRRGGRKKRITIKIP